MKKPAESLTWRSNTMVGVARIEVATLRCEHSARGGKLHKKWSLWYVTERLESEYHYQGWWREAGFRFHAMKSCKLSWVEQSTVVDSMFVKWAALLISMPYTGLQTFFRWMRRHSFGRLQGKCRTPADRPRRARRMFDYSERSDANTRSIACRKRVRTL